MVYNVIILNANYVRRRSQVVRHGSATPLRAGSNPADAFV